MLEFLFQTIIYPIFAILEVAFFCIYKYMGQNIFFTILMISYIVFVACLPLYMNADKLQEEENEIQKRLAPKVGSIKRNFKGDEKFLLLQTYYRQNHYNPIMGLRQSFSLLLQIPFFLGAYIFFHNLSLLNGFPMGNIEDLSKPDGLWHIGKLTVNMLPIMMTVVNIFAGYIYAKDKSFKQNLQLWIMSLIFLILLYNSPAGLVLYWLFNNFFSLIKNIGLRIFSHEKFWHVVLIFTLILYYAFAKYWNFNLDIVIWILASIIIFKGKDFNKFMPSFDPKWLFFSSCTGLASLFGLLIPTSVIVTSPVEFMFTKLNFTAVNLACYPLMQSFGLFVLWGGIIYFFSNKFWRKILAIIALLVFTISIINMLVIPLPQASLQANLTFNIPEINFQTLNHHNHYLYILGSAIGLIILLLIKGRRLLQQLTCVALTSILIVGAINFAGIYKETKRLETVSISDVKLNDKVFNFSKTKKNVLVLFLDRAMSSYLPLVFKEKPELEDAFDGFVYYPNTISYAPYTIIGYQAIMGGYDYTPLNIAKRDKEPLFDKYNEAITMLPRIFRENNWSTIVTDTPGHGWSYSFLDIDRFKKYDISYTKVRGNLGTDFFNKRDIDTNNKNLVIRNLLYFSLLKTSFAKTRNFLYSNGQYLNANYAGFINSDTLDNYAELYYLPQFTDFSAQNNTFIVLNNDLTHEPEFLNYPDYTYEVNNKIGFPYDFKNDDFSIKSYNVYAAAIRLVATYFDYLKQNGIWDNTRIILVSDHGAFAVHPEFSNWEERDILPLNPLLLVKDFNAKGKIKTSNEFMTNADVPILATKGLIKNPKNPYNNKILSDKEKYNGAYMIYNNKWSPTNYEGKTSPLTKEDKLFFVKNDIFKQNNWIENIPAEKVTPYISK